LELMLSFASILGSLIKKPLALVLVLMSICLAAQSDFDNAVASKLIDLGSVSDGNEQFDHYAPLKELLNGVDIVMLGEESHGDATTYQTKIKLIKYLHQEMGFDMLAFESGFYDCQKAWSLIQQGEDVSVSLAKSIFYLWKPLVVTGFDMQWTGKLSKEFYLKDLTTYLTQVDPRLIQTNGWKYLNASLEYLSTENYKALAKCKTGQDTLYLNTLVETLSSLKQDSLSRFWIQNLISTKTIFAETRREAVLRDDQMAANLIWLKEQHPTRKIICWGATSHFLYNSQKIRLKGIPFNIIDGYYKKYPSMGNVLKRKYGDKLFTIGFTAYQGSSGLWKERELKIPRENSVEYVIGKSDQENSLLPLGGLNTTGYLSRPLSYIYMKNSISEVMDAVIFNRNMRQPSLDRTFFLQVHPEATWLKPEATEVQQ